MADTHRSKTDLLSLLVIGGAQEISAQDLRDFVETMHPPFGSLYFTTPIATTFGGSSTPTKALGTTTLVNTHRVTDNGGTSNRLLYTGIPDIHAHIAASISFTMAGNNKTAGLSIALNGTQLDHSFLTRKVSTGADVGATAIHADTMLSTGDYLELFVSNETDTVDLTIEQGYMFFLGMMI